MWVCYRGFTEQGLIKKSVTYRVELINQKVGFIKGRSAFKTVGIINGWVHWKVLQHMGAYWGERV